MLGEVVVATVHERGTLRCRGTDVQSERARYPPATSAYDGCASFRPACCSSSPARVSTRKPYVTAAANAHATDRKTSSLGIPMSALRMGKKNVPTTAPSFAIEAANPAPVARMDVGNVSPDSK